jgi:hypothetical protein
MGKSILIVKAPNSYSSQRLDEFGIALESNDAIKKDYDIFVLPNIEDVFDFRVFNNKYGEEAYYRLKQLIEELKK